MKARVVEIDSLPQAEAGLFSIGSDKAGVKIMAPKAVSRAVKLSGIKPPAANIIKQEMLSFGGEAATAYGSINHSVKETDLLVFGTLRQLSQLVDKMKLHQFGLPQLGAEIEEALRNYNSDPKPFRIGKKYFKFGRRTYIMGILNVTPDSFSDGGKFTSVDGALAHARRMLNDGADIIDVGGESTRPGSRAVSTREEKIRVLPVIEKIVRETGAIVSIDTRKSEVARAAVKAGASMVNDVSGLRFDRKMAKTIAALGVPVCIMHMRGEPENMQDDPRYSDLLGEIIGSLNEGLEIAEKAGILHGKIIVDPGIGFGKTVPQNLQIIRRARELKVLGCPVLIGPSRKSVIGKVLGLPAGERVEGTAALAAVSIMNGVDMLRVHDVKEIARAAKMADAVIRTSTGSHSRRKK